MSKFSEIFELIKKYDTIIIHRHKNPDGDAYGSQIGLKESILATYPKKRVYAVGDSSPRFLFMKGSEMDVIDDGLYKNALAIVLDTSAATLISDERYKTAAATARIDHHLFVEKICDTELTDTSYESCAGLVTELISECGLKFTSTARAALYTGMVTDSGRFRYDSTNSNTHRLASILMEEKIDTSEIYKNLYVDDLSFVKLRASFVLKINVTERGTAYIYTTKEEALATGADTFTISRGMVNTMGDLRGVHSWVNFTETEDGVLAELRSSLYNVNQVAVKYGGGGHQKASGATLKDRNEAMNMLHDIDMLNANV